MMINFDTMFEGEKLKTQTAPLEKGDHPELDASEILDYEGIKKYQSMIGAFCGLYLLEDLIYFVQ